MRDPTGDPGEDSLCGHGVRYLLRQLAAMQAELPGVADRQDAEHVHRMRVATRRFRSALPLFSLCLPERRVRRWRRELRRIARALGEARDADVQIAYLQEYLAWARTGGPGRFRETLPAEIPGKAFPVPARPRLDRFLAILRRVRSSIAGIVHRIGTTPGRGVTPEDRPNVPVAAAPADGRGRQDPVPGIGYLLLRYRQRRDLLQQGIEDAVTALEGEKTFGRLERRLTEMAAGGAGSTSSPEEARAAAFVSLSLRIDILLSHGEALADPDRVREHHAMRIAGKRLRYALEAWGDLYGGAFEDGIATLKRLQDLLGELHDCDVWIAAIPGFVREEEERSRAFFGDDRHFRNLIAGIRAILADRTQERIRLHGLCLTLWRDLAFRGYWEALRETALRPLIPSRPGGFLRIGLLGGIYGNAGALSAVIADGQARGADLFLNAGNTLGPGDDRHYVVEIIRRNGVVSVIGDHDLEILGMAGPAGKRRRRRPGAVRGMSDETRRYMESLPASVRLSVAGKEILLVHGFPSSPGVPGEAFGETRAGAVVSCQGRLPSIRSEGNTLFVNPGAVGGFGDGITLPGYAILEIAPGGSMTATHYGIRDGGQAG